MFGWNRTEIIGNVGATPELRFTPSGTSVISFSVAVNRRYTKDGEKVESTEWFSVVAWNKLAESCNQYLKKGKAVFVSGRVSLHKWEKPDGTETSRLEINANSVIFLSKSEGQEADSVNSSVDTEPEDVPF